jgi:hypothetical protein
MYYDNISTFALLFITFYGEIAMEKNKIVFQVSRKNKHICVYCPSTQISFASRIYFESPIIFTGKKIEKYLKQIGELGELIVIGLLFIKGIRWLYIEEYEIGVAKARGFEWENIHKQIIAVLKRTIWENDPDHKEIDVYEDIKGKPDLEEGKDTEDIAI